MAGDGWRPGDRFAVELVGAKPFLANEARRSGHWSTLAARKQEWQDLTVVTLRAAKAPTGFGAVGVELTPRWDRPGPLPDVDAVAPTGKAVVDGLVACGVVPDDSPAHVRWLRLWAPVRVGKGAGSVLVTVEVIE